MVNCKTKSKNKMELRVKHQQFVQTFLLEEFIKVYMQPTRIIKMLELGYTIDELEHIL